MALAKEFASLPFVVLALDIQLVRTLISYCIRGVALLSVALLFACGIVGLRQCLCM